MSHRNILKFEEFQRHTQHHQLKINLNEGLYRDITFHKIDGSEYHFNITTRPGYLIFTGDMGSFTFKRSNDMVEFFLSDKPEVDYINPEYWAEKVTASPNCGTHEHSKELAKSFLAQELSEYIEELRENDRDYEGDTRNYSNEYNVSPENLKKIEQANEWINNTLTYDHKHQFFEKLYNMNPSETGGFIISDPFDCNFNEPTYSYLWCCYAIKWGLSQYKQAITR